MQVTALVAFKHLLLQAANSTPYLVHTFPTNLVTAFLTVENSSVDINTDPLELLET